MLKADEVNAPPPLGWNLMRELPREGQAVGVELVSGAP